MYLVVGDFIQRFRIQQRSRNRTQLGGGLTVQPYLHVVFFLSSGSELSGRVLYSAVPDSATFAEPDSAPLAARQYRHLSIKSSLLVQKQEPLFQAGTVPLTCCIMPILLLRNCTSVEPNASPVTA